MAVELGHGGTHGFGDQYDLPSLGATRRALRIDGASPVPVIEVAVCSRHQHTGLSLAVRSERTSETTLAAVLLEAMVVRPPRSRGSVGHASIHCHVLQRICHLAYWTGANIPVGVCWRRWRLRPRSPLQLTLARRKVRVWRARGTRRVVESDGKIERCQVAWG